MLAEDVEDLPILGEPLPVELANTLYASPEARLDFLGDLHTAGLWLSASPLAPLLGPPLGAPGLGRLRRLRDAVRGLMLAHVDGARPDPAHLRAVNAALEQGPARRLALDAQGCLRVEARPAAGPVARLRGAIAVATLDFVADGLLRSVRRCPGPGCPMLFVAAHHRRKFCHPSCSHRARQAAYYRRQRGLR